MKKRILIVLLAFTLAFSLVAMTACGSDKEESKEPEKQEQEIEEEEQEEPEEEPEDDDSFDTLQEFVDYMNNSEDGDDLSASVEDSGFKFRLYADGDTMVYEYTCIEDPGISYEDYAAAMDETVDSMKSSAESVKEGLKPLGLDIEVRFVFCDTEGNEFWRYDSADE